MYRYVKTNNLNTCIFMFIAYVLYIISQFFYIVVTYPYCVDVPLDITFQRRNWQDKVKHLKFQSC